MKEFKVRLTVPGGTSLITFHADTYEADDGLITFEDDDCECVYVCNSKNLIDIVFRDLNEDEDDEDDEHHNINSHHLLIENIATVLPQEHK
jgi:hypothetical protein